VNTSRWGDFAFLPLGGCGEIGMNLNLYYLDGKWLAVDCGIGFASSLIPETEILVPDPFFIAERREDLVGLVITHAHEDHLGAVAALWPELGCPVYASPFAAALLRFKLAEAGLKGEVPLQVITPGAPLSLAPFEIETIPVTHSTPEAFALALRTPHGLVVHSGDWKLDPEPLIGAPVDEGAFARLGEEGVLAFFCDSTNALVEGHSGSESLVRKTFAALIRGLRGRVAVTCFASNVVRLESIALAARDAGRRVALVGRSLRTIDAAARSVGYLREVPPFLDEREAREVPDDELLLIVAGSQGEARSALSRIAADTHPHISLGAGDTVIFSSRVIPGNEMAIAEVQDRLARLGVRVMTDEDHTVHVSGHPARDELRRLYRLLRPRYAIPIHGEWRHIKAHAELAAEMGAKPVTLGDGDILRLAPAPVAVVDSAPTGALALEGKRLLPMSGAVMQARRRMRHEGVMFATLVVDQRGQLLEPPRLSAPGLFAEDEEVAREIEEDFIAELEALAPPVRRDREALENAVRGLLRRLAGRYFGKKPLLEIHLIRV
jgi:ribonuclease J